MPVKVIDKGRALIERRLVLLEGQKLYVGVQDRRADRPHPKGGARVGDVAKFIQYGTVNQPARPFMDLSIAEIKQWGRDAMREVVRNVVKRKARGAVSLTWKPLGKFAAEVTKDSIERVGAVDTGTTRDSVTYTVREGEQIVEQGS